MKRKAALAPRSGSGALSASRQHVIIQSIPRKFVKGSRSEKPFPGVSFEDLCITHIAGEHVGAFVA